MKNKKVLIPIVAIIIGLVAGFGIWVAVSPAYPLETIEEADALVHREESDYFVIEARLPARIGLPSATAERKARAIIGEEITSRIKEFKDENHFDILTEADIDIQGLNENRRYALEFSYVAYESPAHRSIVFSAYHDTLGAHPNAYFFSFTFNLEGELVTLPELLAPDTDRVRIGRITKEAQKQVIEAIIERTGGTPEEASHSYYSEGVSADEENFRAFALNGDEITFFIAPYQVAPYALGTFQIRMPFAEVVK